MSEKRLLCDGWEFVKCPLGTEYSSGLKFEAVDLPHDWLIYDTRNLYETSTGWYRRKLEYVPDGKRRSLRFEGVYMDSRVFVNGNQVGEWKYGYTTFEFDITDELVSGENLITVSVNHQDPNSRWYSGAGIYRRVWLKSYPQEHILRDGVYISADVDGTVTVSTETERPEGENVAGLIVRNTIYKDEKEAARVQNSVLAACDERIPMSVRRSGAKYSMNVDTVHVENPRLWDPEDPFLYTCVTELLKDGQVIDTEKTRFGFRSMEFRPDSGFFLNGRHFKLHGCCEHHDLGALGAAVNTAAIRRKLTILKTMGVNAIRTSHNPTAVEFMELADEMGLVVLAECFDMWEMSKTAYDYARFFKEWSRTDVDSWVRRDRNHPCVAAWSIGNEIYDTHASEHGMEIASALALYVRQSDWRSNGYVTQGSNFMQWENAQKCADILKLAGYNYAERLYDEHHAAHPDWMIYGSETSSVVQSRGIYHFPQSQAFLCDDDEQCSALGNTTTGWAAKCTEACIIPDRDRDYVAGQFIWSGFDYIGEPTPYNTKNSYFGQFDTAGFAKDSVYIFQSAWTDYRKAPFVHVYPYWDFDEGQEIDVRVASNAPRVALFCNGRLIKEEYIDREHGTHITMDAKLCYEPGEICAVAYDEENREIARDCQYNFGESAVLRAEADKLEFAADGCDMVFVTVWTEDKDGRPVQNAQDRVHFSVKGAGRLVGLDNGDSTDYDSYKGVSKRLFSGKLLAMIAAATQPGEVEVRMTSEGLKPVTLKLKALPAKVTEGISASWENSEAYVECPDANHDIPVRRVGFECSDTVFTPERKTMTVKTRVYPAGSTYAGQIDYRVTSIMGIDTNIARIISKDSEGVTLECLGDGEFYLRALCKNGTEKYHVMCIKKFSAEGLGSAFYNPYEFICGGLYSEVTGSGRNGINKGAGFGDAAGRVIYRNVDFGKYGSAVFTIPIFANCTTPVRFKVYAARSGEEPALAGEFEYFKQPIWMTYQEETYTLNRRLKGVCDVVFESSGGFDFGGFSFEKPRKETMEMAAVDSDSIYGDKFTVEADAVTGIGNNVVIDFGEYDFSQKAPKAVVITGKSALEKNSIHVCFTSDTQVRTLAEFEGSDHYTERRFELNVTRGKMKVGFTFLPGTDFDFKSFRFEY